MTNWRELLDEYEECANDAGVIISRGQDANQEVTNRVRARRAIELALNRAGVMCFSCGVSPSGNYTWTYGSDSERRCCRCKQPFDAPEGT
jgi:hypothetical protein